MHLRLVGLHPTEALRDLPEVGGSQVIDPEKSYDWRDDASCVFVDDKNIFFAETKTLQGSLDHELALGVCITCPVRVPCLKEGMDQQHGIWGGWSAEDRNELRERIKHVPHVVQTVLITKAAQTGPARSL